MTTSADLSSKPVDEQKSKLPSGKFVFWLVIFAMVLLGTNMRSQIVLLGSMAPVIQEALGISEIQIGWLGAVPMLTFAVGALISPAIGKRFGIENTLIVMIAVLTVGIVMRAVIPTWGGFLGGTALLTLAVGFANTLAAPVIKQRTPNHIPLVTGIFSLTMTVSAGLVSGVVLPLSERVGWQWAIGGWAILGILALVVWIFMRTQLGAPISSQVSGANVAPQVSVWRSAFAWQVAIFMGIQSLLFYTVASFLPLIWISRGLEAKTAGQMGSIFQFMAPISIITLTWLINRGRPIRALAILAAVLNFIGVLGLGYLSPSWSLIWSGMMGLGCSAIFTLSMMLFSLRTYTTNQASELSGMAQGVGYILAFFGPLGTGFLHEITGNWNTPILVMLGFMAVNIWLAWLICRPVMVDGKAIR